MTQNLIGLQLLPGRLAAVALTHPELFPVKPSLRFNALDEIEDEEPEEAIAAKS